MIKKRLIIKKAEKRRLIIEKPGEYMVELAGRGAGIEVLAAVRVGDEQEFALKVVVRHKAYETSSNVFIRLAAGKRSKVSVEGLIKIDKKAEKSVAFLKEDVLLLADNVKAEVIPDLEIKTNDVSCSHAATLGEINKKQLFYLRSRGIYEKEAKNLIAEGFLKEARDKIKKGANV